MADTSSQSGIPRNQRTGTIENGPHSSKNSASVPMRFMNRAGASTYPLRREEAQSLTAATESTSSL